MKAVNESTGVSQGANTTYEAENPSQDRLVVKNGAHFLIMNPQGMMPLSTGVPAPFGLFRDDTRYLSAWQIFINKTHPRLLASDIASGFQADFVYGNVKVGDIPEQSVLVTRNIVIEDRLAEKLTVTNYHTQVVDVELAIVFDTDFADMFEVRGAQRPARGTLYPLRQATLFDKRPRGTKERPVRGPLVKRAGKRVTAIYHGLDGSEMRTTIDVRSTAACAVEKSVIVFKLHLEPRQSQVIETFVVTQAEASLNGLAFVNASSTKHTKSFGELQELAQSGYTCWRNDGARVTTGDTTFNDVLERAFRDLYVLRQPTPHGMCVGAGTPWFAAAFGRDQAVAALQALQLMPSLAKEVISVLAAYQGKQHDDFTEERPGKILHELRLGEMARCGEIPFKPYYGTVDATPLWLMLVSRYVEATGDLELARKVWGNIKRALTFLDIEIAPTGYLTYGGKPGAALSNQGWKDSGDSIMYSSGKLAQAPIALCEPQGYIYEAWSRLAGIARRLGDEVMAQELACKAKSLKLRFIRDFWMPEHNFVALALDRDGEHCDVISSNPGHLLSTGILEEGKAQLVAAKLMSKEMFCGWGIRTLAEGQAAYNPMSYHNGSVWPHDNGLAVEGLAAIGRVKDAQRVLRGLFAAAAHQPDLRLPELFCGFDNPQTQAPIRYPVSCVPQAWAAGTMLQILTAILGIEIQPTKLSVVNPSVPTWLGSVLVEGLTVGSNRVDLRFDTTSDGATKVTVVRNENDVVVEIED